jgi:hypothetical protein
MFAPGAPPLPWDETRDYTRARLQLFFCSHMGTVLKEAQLVDALRGRYPDKYVETGCQVRAGCCAGWSHAWHQKRSCLLGAHQTDRGPCLLCGIGSFCGCGAAKEGLMVCLPLCPVRCGALQCGFSSWELSCPMLRPCRSQTRRMPYPLISNA